MKITLFFRLFAIIASVSVFQIQSNAQGAPAAQPVEAEVVSVKFSAARFGGDTWLEADVEVEAKPGGKLVSGQFVNRVRVSLSVGMDGTNDKGEKTISFYRSSAEALSLEGGRSNIRFYFPPEIVKRDKLRTPVNFYAAEVEVAGQIQAPSRSSFASGFTSPASLQNFLSKVSAESGANEGLLIPQFLTPFSADPQKRAPTFFRKEALR